MSYPNPPLRLSIFLVASHADPIFKRCIESVLAHLPKNSEVLIVFNGAQPKKEAWVESLKHPSILTFSTTLSCVSNLRNLAFTMCSGDILHFLDDDVIVPPNLFSKLLHAFEKDPALSIAGGPNLTPLDSSFPQKLFGAVLTSPFAAPFVFKRYSKKENSPHASGLDLILCNLAMRRVHVPSSLRFCEGLYPNEETLFLHRARRKKLKTSYFGDFFVFHHRRKNFGLFLKQISGYGFGRGKQTWLEPFSFPLALILPLVSLLFLMPVFFSWPVIAGSYVVGSLLGWVYSKEARQTGLMGLLMAPFLTLAVHLSYLVGTGKAVGYVLTVPFPRPASPRLAES